MRLLKLAALFVLPLAVWACDRPGPAERFGEEVDEAVEDVRNGDETLGNRLDDAADDVRDEIAEAREELEQ